MLIFDDKGIRISDSGSTIGVDTSKEDFAVITHAHSDHAKLNGKGSYLMTPATMDLLNGRGEKSDIKTADFGKKYRHENLDISLHNAGHILGSSQVVVEGSKKVVVTADFKFQENSVLPAAKPIPCDILLMETTYGLPHHAFPPRSETYSEMVKWISGELARKKFIVLAGYATGKAQELTKFCNDFMEETPLVHEKIYENNLTYEKHGVKLGPCLKLDHNLEQANILIMPPSLVNHHVLDAVSHSLNKDVVSAFASGWKFGGYTRTFSLSDHADFGQLLHYVQEAKPKLVLTHHGYAKEFARHVHRRFGIPARPLGNASQKTILEY